MSVPEGIDAETGEIIAPPSGFRLAWEPMDAEQAKSITTQINAYSIRLPMLVKEARDAEAWKALGCATWTEYVEEHLVISTEYARLLLRGADKLEELASATGVPVDMFVIPERVLRAIDTPTMVGVASEAVASLPATATETEKSQAVDNAVRQKVTEQQLEDAARRGREKAAADLAAAKVRKEAAEAEARAERERQDAERAARKAAANKTSDGGGPPAPSSGTPDQEPSRPGTGKHPDASAEPAAAAASGDGGTGETAPPAGPVPGATQPVLPDDWSNRIARATHLLGCPIDLLRPLLTDDDRIDLQDLHTYLTDLLKEN